MFEYLESISITEGEQIKKTIQALFRQTCILQVKYDPATLVPKDNVQYEICVRHRHFIEDYLSVLGCELTHDAQEHIFCLTGDGAAREKLNMTETVILLIIKLIYKDKIMGEGLNAPVTTLKEMREYGKIPVRWTPFSARWISCRNGSPAAAWLATRPTSYLFPVWVPSV